VYSDVDIVLKSLGLALQWCDMVMKDGGGSGAENGNYKV
jgi:hypothetical protein